MRILRFLPPFRRIYQLMDTLAKSEQSSRSAIAELQLEKINQIWQQAIVYVPYYRKVFRERRLPREFQSLEEYTSSVPVLEKATVRSGTLLSQRPRPGKWHYTAGSTGIPLAIYRERDAQEENLASQYRSRALWCVDPLDRMALLWGHGVAFPPANASEWRSVFEQRAKDVLLDRLRLSTYRLGKEDLRRYLRMMANSKSVVLYGYSSAVKLLALEALESDTSVESLKLVVLTAELVTQDIRRTVQTGFQTNVIEEYGAAECQLIAYEDNQHLLRAREDLVLVETLPRQDNMYSIIITGLNNASFPLLRYDIEDLTDKPLNHPYAGFATLGPIIGRNLDYLISSTGRQVRVQSSDVTHRASASIKRLRVHQFSDGRVLLLLEVDSAATSSIDVVGIRKNVSALLGGLSVEVRLTESIPPTPGGKHRWVVSELAASSRST